MLFDEGSCQECYCCKHPATFDSIDQALSHVEFDIVFKNEFNYVYKCSSCKKYHDCSHAANRKIEVYI